MLPGEAIIKDAPVFVGEKLHLAQPYVLDTLAITFLQFVRPAHPAGKKNNHLIAGQTKQRQGLLLDEHAGWKFWRFDLEALLGDSARVLEYSIEAEQMDKSTR